jgi:hypothetical protein
MRGKSGKAWWIFQDSGRTLLIAIVLLLSSLVLRQCDAIRPGASVVDAANTPFNWQPWFSFFDDLIKELGVALLVAVVIVEGIERLSRREQNEEVARLIDKVKTGVLEAVYGTEIAAVFFTPFRKVIDHPLLRKQCDLSVTLSILRMGDASRIQDNDVVLLEVTSTFVLKNCSNGEFTQKIPAFLEKPWPELSGDGLPEPGIKGIRVRRIDGVTEEIAAKTSPAAPGSRNDLDEVGYEIRLDSSEVVTVIYSYGLVKYARDSSSFFTTIPTEAMRFNFTYDTRLSLYYTNVHGVDFFDETPAKSSGRLTLRSAGPLFPANGIEFWWAPSGTAASRKP